MSGASFEHTVHILADSDQVWGRLQQAQSWAMIGPMQTVANPSIGGGGELLGFNWRAEAAGRRILGTARTTASLKPERMVVELDTQDVRGVLVAALKGHTDLTVQLALAPKSFLASLIFGVIAKAIGDALPDELEAFAGTF